jgi:tetratricopeptide (TPR) repeat protein
MRLLGQALIALGEVDEALNVLRRAQLRFPGDQGIASLAADAAARHSPPLWAEALRSYAAARALGPGSVSLLVSFGVAARGSGDVAVAESAFREAISRDPENAVSHYDLGVVLRDAGNIDEAIASLREAVRIDPALAPAHNNLAGCLLGRGDSDGRCARRGWRSRARFDARRATACWAACCSRSRASPRRRPSSARR